MNLASHPTETNNRTGDTAEGSRNVSPMPYTKAGVPAEPPGFRYPIMALRYGTYFYDHAINGCAVIIRPIRREHEHEMSQWGANVLLSIPGCKPMGKEIRLLTLSTWSGFLCIIAHRVRCIIKVYVFLLCSGGDWRKSIQRRPPPTGRRISGFNPATSNKWWQRTFEPTPQPKITTPRNLYQRDKEPRTLFQARYHGLRRQGPATNQRSRSTADVQDHTWSTLRRGNGLLRGKQTTRRYRRQEGQRQTAGADHPAGDPTTTRGTAGTRRTPHATWRQTRRDEQR